MHTLLELVNASQFLMGEGAEFVSPTLEHEFDPAPIFFVGTPFEMNRILLIRMIAALFVLLICVLYARRAKLVPGRSQALAEGLFNFSLVSVSKEILGEEDGRKYAPIIMTIFLGVLFMNITGVIPGLQIAATSLVGMPLIYALFATVSFIAAGIKRNGFGKFFQAQLAPSGLPKPIYLLLVPLEFLSTFIIRPMTLTIRLLANMVAGHFILVLCFTGAHFLYFQLSGALALGTGTLALIAGVVFVLFELFVGAIQAYIFALLASTYILLSVSHD
ncbi:MAG: F0F1 ATP synthase subunit A [Trueperella sp.]|nr:F0F1 ATP synthase subunit A [Trueperella sp.]